MNKVFLLYSNFSDYCKQLTPIVPTDIKTLCIDNPKIRSKILKSKNFNISIVPTIIIFNNNTPIIYEGQDATNFINSLIQNDKKLIVKEEIAEHTKEDQINKTPISHENDNDDETIGRTSISDLFEENDNDDETIGRTSISDLFEENDNDDETIGRTSISDLFEDEDDIEEEIEEEKENETLMEKVERMKTSRGND
jgi:hypothetical protein